MKSIFLYLCILYSPSHAFHLKDFSYNNSLKNNIKVHYKQHFKKIHTKFIKFAHFLYIYRKDFIIGMLSTGICISFFRSWYIKPDKAMEEITERVTNIPSTSIAQQQTREDFLHQKIMLGTNSSEAAQVTEKPSDALSQSDNNPADLNFDIAKQSTSDTTINISYLAHLTFHNWLNTFNLKHDQIKIYRSIDFFYILNKDHSISLMLNKKKLPEIWRMILDTNAIECKTYEDIPQQSSTGIRYKLRCMEKIDISSYLELHTYGQILQENSVLRDMNITCVNIVKNNIYLKNQYNTTFCLKDTVNEHKTYTALSKNTEAFITSTNSHHTDFELEIVK